MRKLKVKGTKKRLSEAFYLNDASEAFVKPFNEMTDQEKGYVIAVALINGKDFIEQLALELGESREAMATKYINFKRALMDCKTVADAVLGIVSYINESEFDKAALLARINVRSAS